MLPSKILFQKEKKKERKKIRNKELVKGSFGA